MIVALIPARGGSRRLPRKNLRLFAGRPLLYYSIAVAQAVRAIDRCIVSTEDDEMSEVALTYGSEVIRRPAELADDFATTGAVARHALEHLVQRGEQPRVLVTLQPTCPLRPVSLVQEALDLFAAADVDTVATVTQNHRKLGEIHQGLFQPCYPPGIRSQDMTPTYYENGLVYVTRVSLALEEGRIFGERTIPLITDPLYARADIDDLVDFQIAEFLYMTYRERFECPATHSLDQEAVCVTSR